MQQTASIADDAGQAAIVGAIDETVADAYAKTSFQEALHILAQHARLMIGAHQSALSYIPDGNFKAAVHTHSFSTKYAKYTSYDAMPTGEGIYGVIVETKVPLRMTQQQLESHPRWKNFGDLKDERGLEHPPMVGWLAVPVLRQNGDFIGLIQLSDKIDGEFTEEDQQLLSRLAGVISPTFDLQYVNHVLEVRTCDLAEINTQLKAEITERNRAEAMLRANEEQLRLVTDALPALIAFVDAEQRYRMNNKAYETWFGFTPTYLKGKHCRTAMGDTIYETIRPYIERALSGETVTYETDIPNTSTGTRHVSVIYIPHVSQDGHVEGFFLLVTDLTERKKADKQQEFLISELEAKNAELERFLYTVSHGLKSPLITIGVLIGMLEREVADDKTESMARHFVSLQEATKSLNQKLQDLLALAKVGSLAIQRNTIPFAASAQTVCQLINGLIANQAVQVHIAPNLPSIHADVIRLEEVLQNLIENAVKYMGDQPHRRIDIGCRRDGDEDVWFVQDNGMGIDPQFHEKVFGLFNQLNRESDGTGIGLALARRIIKLHNGRIWMESEGSGHGCTVCFTVG